MRSVCTLLHNNKGSKTWRIVLFTIVINLIFHLFYILLAKYHIVMNHPELKYWLYNNGSPNNKYQCPYIRKTNRSQIEPIILHWTPFGKGPLYPNHLSTFITHFSSCKYKCLHTEDRTFVDNAQAILFHTFYTDKNDLPPERSDQYRVLVTRESPYHCLFPINTKLRSNYFNLTVAHRTFADVLLPYGYFRPLDGSEKAKNLWSEDEIDRRISMKSKLALSVISHCETFSKREDYLDQLRLKMKITSIGSCRNYSNSNCKDETCIQNFAKDHYFYLAFENSVCPEYVTEKFFRIYELMVPVVLTRSTMPSNIPSDSYIAASDFESAEKLANFLKKTSSNVTEYKKFFKWTSHYRKLDYEYYHKEEGCQLCELIHKSYQPKYADYTKFMDKSVCSLNFGQKLAENNRLWIVSEEQRIRKIMNSESVNRPWYFN